MKTAWTVGLSVEEKNEIRAAYAASGRLRARLTEMLEKKQKETYHKSLSEDGYTNANWAYTQADAVGFQRAIDMVISLIEK